jgi:hypothetical protein
MASTRVSSSGGKGGRGRGVVGMRLRREHWCKVKVFRLSN